jgi:hypothetical protein
MAITSMKTLPVLAMRASPKKLHSSVSAPSLDFSVRPERV